MTSYEVVDGRRRVRLAVRVTSITYPGAPRVRTVGKVLTVVGTVPDPFQAVRRLIGYETKVMQEEVQHG